MNSGDTLWDFSCAVYGTDGVQAACLSLQNQYAADIPLLLFCLWLGQDHKRLSDEQKQQVLYYTSSWQERCIKPLRKIRQEMKGAELKSISSKSMTIEQEDFSSVWSSTRDQVKAIELEAEHALLNMLQAYALHSIDEASTEPLSKPSSKNATLECMLANIAACLPQVFSNLNDLALILSAVEPKIPYDDMLNTITQYSMS